MELKSFLLTFNLECSHVKLCHCKSSAGSKTNTGKYLIKTIQIDINMVNSSRFKPTSDFAVPPRSHTSPL